MYMYIMHIGLFHRSSAIYFAFEMICNSINTVTKASFIFTSTKYSLLQIYNRGAIRLYWWW